MVGTFDIFSGNWIVQGMTLKASSEMLVSMAKIGTLKRVNIEVIFIGSLSFSLKDSTILL
jgi:hypothetical protein